LILKYIWTYRCWYIFDSTYNFFVTYYISYDFYLWSSYE